MSFVADSIFDFNSSEIEYLSSLYCKHLNKDLTVRSSYTDSRGQIRLLGRALDIVVLSAQGEPKELWDVQGCEVRSFTYASTIRKSMFILNFFSRSTNM